VFYSAKAFCLEPERAQRSDFASQPGQPHRGRTIPQNELTELGLSAVHLKDCTGLSVQNDIHLKLFLCKQFTAFE